MSTLFTREETWDLIEKVLASPISRVLLTGPSGTGKTHAVCMAGLRPGEIVFSDTMYEDKPAMDLLGYRTVMNGSEAWVDGLLVKAWRLSHEKPVRFCIQEINHAGPDVQSICHVLLDDITSAQITLPTGETVKPGPHLKVYATMNGDADGLIASLRDRFSVVVPVQYPSPGALESIPDVYRPLVLARTTEAGTGREVSIRRYQALHTLIESGLPLKDAIRCTHGHDHAKDFEILSHADLKTPLKGTPRTTAKRTTKTAKA